MLTPRQGTHRNEPPCLLPLRRQATRPETNRTTAMKTDDTSWMNQAACKGTDPALFIPDKGGRGAAADGSTSAYYHAKQQCVRCPVITECLLWAINHREKKGMWGGTTPKERQAIRLMLKPVQG